VFSIPFPVLDLDDDAELEEVTSTTPLRSLVLEALIARTLVLEDVL
jgi:hypothetical protein